MITSNGSRVFIDNKSSVVCYNLDFTNDTWTPYGAHYLNGAEKNGQVVITSENTNIGWNANKGGNLVVAHNMGTTNVDIFEINTKTLVWKKIQTLQNIENYTSYSGAYVFDFIGNHMILYVDDSNDQGNVLYYAYNTSTKQFDLKFTLSNPSGISNEKSHRRVVMNKDGSRFAISDTNGNVYDPTTNDNGDGVVKIYDVNTSSYTYTLVGTLTSSNSSALFGESLSMNLSGSKIVVGEPLERSYYPYEYASSSWSLIGGNSLSFSDTTTERYNNIVKMNALGDAFFVSEFDSINDTEDGIVYGFYQDSSDNWNEYEELSGNFYVDISGSIDTNLFEIDGSTNFASTPDFGSLLSLNSQGNRLLVGSNHSQNKLEAIVLKLKKDTSAPTQSLKDLGVSGSDIVKLELTPAELVGDSGLNTEELKELGVGADTLLTGGTSESDLLSSGFGLDDIVGASNDLSSLVSDPSNNVKAVDLLASASVSDLLTKGIEVSDLLGDISGGDASGTTIDFSQFKDANVSASDLKDSGIDATTLKDAAYGAGDLVNAGFAVSELKDAAIPASDLKGAGLGFSDLDGTFSPEDLVGADFADSDFENAGYTVEPAKTLTVSVGPITLSQEVKTVVKNPDIDDLTTSLPDSDTTTDIIAKNPSVSNVIQVKALDASGEELNDVSTNPIVMTFDFPELDPNEEHVLCKFDAENKILNPQPVGYPIKLNYNAATQKYTGSFTNLSTASTFFAIKAPPTGPAPVLYITSNDTLVPNSTNGMRDHTFYLTLDVLRRAKRNNSGDNIQQKLNFFNCTCLSSRIYKRWGSLANAVQSNWILKNIKDANPNFIAPDTKNQTISQFNAKYPHQRISNIPGNHKLLAYYEIYEIKIRISNSHILNKRIYIENKISGSRMKEHFSNTWITAKSRFTWQYNKTIPTFLDIYTRDSTIYIHYPNPNNNSIVEYYTNKTGAVKVLLTSNVALDNNLISISSIKTNNGTVTAMNIQRGKLEHELTLYGSIDLLSDSGTTYVSIEFPPGSIIDTQGNTNTQTSSFSYLIDTIPPTMEITSDISTNSTTNTSYINMYLTPSKQIRNLTTDYFEVINGSLGRLIYENGVYTTTLVPNENLLNTDTQISVKLRSNTIQDLGGNKNTTVSNTFVWNYDGSAPTISIESDDVSNNQYYNLDYITAKFIFSEDVVGFTIDSINIVNGEKKRFKKIDEANYECRIYPEDPINSQRVTVSVPANAVLDLRDNGNFASAPFVWNYDFDKPLITLSSSLASGASSDDGFILYSIFSSKSLSEISLDSFTVENANIVDLQGSGQNFTVKLYPISNQRTSIVVKKFGVRDTANNQNDLKSNSFDPNPYYWTYNGSKPIITLSSSDIDLKGETKSKAIDVIMKINDTSLTLSQSDLSISSNLTISNYGYDATYEYYTFTATIDAPYENATIKMPANVVTDSNNFSNSDSNTLSWEWDKDRATMQVYSTDISSGDLTNDPYVSIVFEPSEEINNFTVSSLSVSNARVTDFTSSTTNNNFTATLRPSVTHGEISLFVDAGKFKSTYGYFNILASNTLIWNYDRRIPVITIGSDFITSGTINNNYSEELFVEFSKDVVQFDSSVFTVRGGYVSNLEKVNDQKYIFKLNTAQTISSIQNVEVFIDRNQIQDPAGNYNTSLSNSFSWKSDTTPIEVVNTYAMYLRGNSQILFSNNTGYEYVKWALDRYYIFFEFSKPYDRNTLNLASMTIKDTIDENGNPVDYTMKSLSYVSNTLARINNFTPRQNVNNKTLFPHKIAKATIFIEKNSIQDIYGNLNTQDTDGFTFIYDITIPEVYTYAKTIDSNEDISSGTTTNDASIYFYVDFSKRIHRHKLDYSKLVASNCTLSSLIWTEVNSTARYVLTPIDRNVQTSVQVLAGFAPDLANLTRLSLAAEDIFYWTSDIEGPIITISTTTEKSEDVVVSNGDTIIIQDLSMVFDFNDAPTSFGVSDISLSNCSIISNTFTTVSSVKYTVDVRGSTDGGNMSVFIPENNTITDSAGNNSKAHNTFAWYYNNVTPKFSSIYSNDVSNNGYTDKEVIYLYLVADTVVYLETTVLQTLIRNGTITNVYSDDNQTFTVTVEKSGTESEKVITIFIPKGTFNDEAGSYNNETYNFTYTFYDIKPLVNITSTVASGTFGKLSSLDIKFSEANGQDLYEFVQSDIKLVPEDTSNYYISDFSGNGSEYTAKLNILQDATVVVYTTINSYRNIVGALNNQESIFKYTKDTAPVTIDIYSSLINSGGESDDGSVELIIQFNKYNIKISDILEVINYTNSSLESLVIDPDDGRKFTTNLIPRVKNTPSRIYISAEDIVDQLGNTNTQASNTFEWTFIGANPTVTITSTQIPNGSVFKQADISLVFELEGDDVELELSDISYTNGTLTNFDGSNNYYTADFQATQKLQESSIFVGAGAITDSFGVSNLPSAKFIWSYNDVSPFITIFNDDGVNTGDFSNKSSFNFRFVASSSNIVGFTIDDVDVSGGTLDALKLENDGITYESIFTPLANVDEGLLQLSISGSSYTNELGVGGLDSNVYQIKYDRVIPTVDLSASLPSGTASSDTYVDIEFIFSKKMKTFNFDDIVAINCDIVNTDTDAETMRTFGITVQPRNNDIVSVKLPAGVAFDEAGNTHAATDAFEWTYDSVAIFNTLTSRDLTRTQDSSTTIEEQRFYIETNDDTITIQETDISYENLEITLFAQEATNAKFYYLNVKPLQESVQNKLFIPANVLQDNAGNYNVASAIYTWVYDSNPPSATISSPDVSSGDITNDDRITLYFDTTEAVSGLKKEVISIINGYIEEDEIIKASDTRYFGTLIPFNNGEVRVSIQQGTFQDLAGVPSSEGNEFVWNYDNVGPSLALKSVPEFASRSYRPEVSISMELIILNDSSLNVVASDISFNQGFIRDFTQTGASNYRFEYVANNSGELNTIFVPSGQISDVAGNTNRQQVSFQWIYDAEPLTIDSFTADVVDLSGTTNQSRVNLALKLSDSAFGVESSLLQFVNCNLVSFNKNTQDETVYDIAVDVLGTSALPSVVVQDDVLITTGRNINKFITGSNLTFHWVYDNEPPILSLSSLQQKNNVKNNTDFIDILISANKPLQAFTKDALSAPLGVSIGDISGYDDISRNFTARITPSATEDVVVRVIPGKIKDSVGNVNEQSDLSFTWYYDITPPEIEISSNVASGSSSATSYIDLSFISTKDIVDFTIDDIDVSNATLTDFNGSGNIYSAILKPKVGNTASTVVVRSQTVFDTAGNENDSSSNTFSWTYTGNDVILTLSSSDVVNGGYYKQSSITMNINTGNSIINSSSLTSDDIVVSNGTISNLQNVDDYNYTFTFTSSNVNQESSVYIPEDKVFSSTNNSDLNNESNTYKWTYDDTKPTVEILSSDMNSGDYNNSPFIFIDISFSEPVTFSGNDISYTNATISNFTGRDDQYSIKVTPSVTNGEISLFIPENVAYDVAENYNDGSSNKFIWNYDNVAPTITLSSDDVNDGDDIDASSIILKITASEDIEGLSFASFSYRDCIISDISGSGQNYTAKITTGDYSKNANISLSIDEGKITDKAGNKNVEDSNEFSFKINKEVVRKKNAATLKTTLTAFSDVDADEVDTTELTMAMETTVSSSLSTKTVLPSFINSNTNKRVFKFIVDQIFERQTTTSKKRARFERAKIPLKNKIETLLGEKEDLIIAQSNQSVSFTELATDTANEAVYIPLSEEGDFIEMTLINGDVLKITQNETDKFEVKKNTTTNLGTFDANDDDNDTLIIGNYTFVFGSLTANYDEPDLGEYIYENCDIEGGAIDNSFTSISSFSSWFSSKSLTWNDAIYITDMGSFKGWKYQQMLSYNSGLTKNGFVQYAIQYAQDYYYEVGVAVYHDKITTSSDDITYITFRETGSTAEYENHTDVYRYVLSATEISGLSSYEITTVPETVVSNATNEDTSGVSGEDTSGNEGTSEPFDWSADGVFVLPCFLEGTNILTTTGYKKIENLIAGFDVLVDDRGNEITCREVKSFKKKYDGKELPYVVPQGSAMNDKFVCTEDLYLTHNHCIYIPHMNKYVPSESLKMPQDKTVVEGYTYYHVFTDNYFTDVIIANGIPCESHSKYIRETIKSIDSSGILLKKILEFCGAKSNGMRKRMTNREFNQIVKKHTKKMKKQSKKRNMKK